MSVRFRLFAAISMFIALPTGVAGAAFKNFNDSEKQIYEYEILREGKPVGKHEVLVDRSDTNSRVEANTLIEIRFLGLTFYRFQYDSVEEWDKNGLLRLQVRVDDDGKRREIAGYRDDRYFHWSVDGQDLKSLEMPIVPTNHWNREILSQSRVLNTLTGRVNRVTIRPLHERGFVLDKENDEFWRYRYNGELTLDSWYDSSGIWLGMSFEGRDGSQIEYRCRNCES